MGWEFNALQKLYQHQKKRSSPVGSTVRNRAATVPVSSGLSERSLFAIESGNVLLQQALHRILQWSWTVSQTVHAFDFLESDQPLTARVVALFGNESFLKARVGEKIRNTCLSGQESEINLIRLPGKQTEFKDIHDELDTISLFGGGSPRLVWLEEAESFVSAHRSELEDYLEAPSQNGILLLDVAEWRSNTRIYKLLDKSHLQIDCRPPMRGKSVDRKKIAKWIAAWGKKTHKIRIQPVVAEHMMDLGGTELGLLDQNMAKLALYFDPKTEISEEDINEYVGGWQTKTIWDLIDHAIGGQTDAALSQLDRLIQNGDAPIALFGQIGWSLRRYALAFDEAHRFRRQGKRMDVDAVMKNAGFRFPPEIKKAISQLKKIGRQKGLQYYRILLECDLALKASHSAPSRARIALEKLILDLVELH